jgi:hypothetical protein
MCEKVLKGVRTCRWVTRQKFGPGRVAHTQHAAYKTARYSVPGCCRISLEAKYY